MRDHAFDFGTETVDSAPGISLFGDKLCRTIPLGICMQNPRPIMLPVRVLAGVLSQRDCTGREHGIGAEISNRKSPGFQVESLSKLAAIFVSFCALSCRMLPSKTRSIRKRFVSRSYRQAQAPGEMRQPGCHSTCTARSPGFSDVGLRVAECGLSVVAHDQ